MECSKVIMYVQPDNKLWLFDTDHCSLAQFAAAADDDDDDKSDGDDALR